MGEWRDDVRSLLKRAGVDGRPNVFLLADSQVKDEGFLEDVSMVLNTGDIPNLYPSEEKAEILDKMMNVARETVCLSISFVFLLFKLNFLVDLLLVSP